MLRLVAVAALVAGVLTTAPSPPAGAVAGFGDVADGAYYAEAVQWMVDNQYTNGTAPGCFSPGRHLSRGELATFLWRYAGEPTGGAEPFTDVHPDEYFADAIAWMVAGAITTGTSATTFHPARTVTRAEAVTFLWRFVGRPTGGTNPFDDVAAGRFFSDAVAWAVADGVTTGTSDTTFHPARPVSRAEIATFLFRLAGEPPTEVDTGGRCGESAVESFADTFDGDGPLLGYTTNNAEALPDVSRTAGRYRAVLTDNSGNRTLHFNQDQGRLDARVVTFPFDYVVRNIGVGMLEDSQTAPAPTGDPYVFAGVQVHTLDLEDRTSSHVVIGHRGGTHFTVEGKNTSSGWSSVNDDGFGVAPLGRVDLRIVGNADRTLTVSWQQPNPSPGATPDSWQLYRGTGDLPGPDPAYGPSVFIGLITYAAGSTGVPFVGTADGIEDYRSN